MSSPSAKELFQSAQDDGILSPGSLQTLVALDIGQEIENALGVPALEVESSEVVLVTVLIDDSGSIRYADNEKAVQDGHNLVIAALTDPQRLTTEQMESIFMHTCYLNGKILFDYRTILNATKMDAKNYSADGGTPLYDQSMIMLGTVIGKAQEFAFEGISVRTISLIVTDGRDEHSLKASPSDVAKLVKDMLRQETHIIAGMGINDGETDFKDVFMSMGLRDEWILTPGNSEHEIREAFRVFSQSAQTGSVNTQSFNTMGGFTP